MRMNFATGLLVGVLLAAVLVVGSGFNQGPALLQPEFSIAATTTQVTTISSTTTASSSSQAAGAASAPSASSNLSASVGSLITSASNAQASTSYFFGPPVSGQPPSSLAVLVKQPTVIPWLLLPVVLALALGFVLFRTTRPKE